LPMGLPGWSKMGGTTTYVIVDPKPHSVPLGKETKARYPFYPMQGEEGKEAEPEHGDGVSTFTRRASREE